VAIKAAFDALAEEVRECKAANRGLSCTDAIMLDMMGEKRDKYGLTYVCARHALSCGRHSHMGRCMPGRVATRARVD
jgi:hypothetical protein